MFRYLWILAIIATSVNGAVWWHRAQPHIASNPQLELGYRRLIRGLLFFGNLPWVVMGLGITVGGVPTVFHFFNPRNGPWVIVWYGTVAALWIATIGWVFFRHGAQALVDHPGLFNAPIHNPWVVKAIVLAAIAGGVAGLAFMITSDIHPPNIG